MEKCFHYIDDELLLILEPLFCGWWSQKKTLESPDPQRDGTWKGMIHMGRIAKLDDDHALMLIGSNGNYPRIG
jgi:hypothetical protein